MTSRTPFARSLPRNIIAIGSVSLLMGISSTMILSLLPAFLVEVLGASALWVGTIEGIAESTASITKVFSGVLSDWIGRRKPLVIVGYALSALVKPLFPLSHALSDVLIARVIDRIGKGIRDAPRDALLADVTSREIRGSGFGLRHALFSVGAVLGPLTAIALMTMTGDNFRLVYWIAVIPALLSVAVLVWSVEESPSNCVPVHRPVRFELRNLALLPPTFWRLVAFASVISLARFSQAFLLLKAVSVGVDAAYVPLVLVLVYAVYSTTSYPLGVLADRVGRHFLLGGGAVILVLADVVLAFAATPAATAFGAALWGLQMGAVQGLFGAIIADIVPEARRGTAFGFYDLIIGVAALIASVTAGTLWVIGGAILTFGMGGALAASAAVMLTIIWRRAPESESLAP